MATPPGVVIDLRAGRPNVAPNVAPHVAPHVAPNVAPNVAPHPLAGRHVLVVGINYAPEPTGIAPYTTGLTEHLIAQGADVEVFTGVPHYPSWRVPRRYRHGLRFTEVEPGIDPGDRRGPRVLRLRHYVPRRQTALRRAAYEATFLLHALAARPRHRPDLVVAATPSLGGAVAAARLARRYRARFVVVVQDLTAKAAEQSGIAGGGRVAGIAGHLEGQALRQADAVAIVSERFRDAVRSYGVPDHRVHLLPNWAHIESAAQTRDEARRLLDWPVEAFVVAHTGNMGLKQDLGNVVAAGRHLGDQATLLLIGDGSQRHEVEMLAAAVPNVHVVDPLRNDQYPLALAAADVLLINERPSVGDMSLPSKLTSYLSAARPVVAAVAPDGATAAELARTGGAGIVVAPADPRALADVLRALRDDPRRRDDMGRRARAYAERELGKDASMRCLDAIVTQACPAGGASAAR